MGLLDWFRGNGVDDLVQGAASGSLTTVEIALNAGVPVDGRSWHGDTPLVAATARRRLAVVDVLLRRGADPRLPSVRMPAHFRDTDLGGAIARNPEAAESLGPLTSVVSIDRPLHLAAKNGDVDIVDMLVDAGANVNDRITGRMTALMIASIHGHLPVVRRLLARNASVHLIADTRGPLQHGAFPGNTDGFTALAFAALHERMSIVQELAEHGATVDPALAMGARPLHIAAANGHIWMVELLLDLGANVDAPMTGFGGSTPLMIAAAAGQKAVVKLLLASGARRDLEDERGWNASSFAESGGHPALAYELAS